MRNKSYIQVMKYKYNIRNRVKHFRLSAGDITQQELAKKAGATRQTIHSIEKGRYNPSIGLSLKIARILNVPVEKLFELDERDEND